MVTSRALANLFDTAALAPHFVGYDSLFDRLNDHYQLHTTTNFPPYNIRKLEENKWQVEVALAGYDKKDIEVKTIEGKLVVATKDNKKEEKKVQSAIQKLEKSKEGSKRTITTLKKQLDNMKTDRKDMETVADKGDVDEAIDFLKKFSKGN